jgi:hypothetical protein
LLALPHLLGRPTQGKKSLMDYFRSHVVTCTEYLKILQKKFEKIIAKEHSKTK